MVTTSSEEMIKYLTDKGHKLTTEDKGFIRTLIFDITSSSYEEGIYEGEKRDNWSEGNGCDCGQPSCSICN